MRSRVAFGLVLSGLAFLPFVGGSEQAAADETKAAANATVSFKNDIQPILSANCVSCHGGRKRKAGYDFTSYASTAKALTSGNADKSRIYKSLIGKGAKQMPPKSNLEDDEIKAIKDWIAAGAKNN